MYGRVLITAAHAGAQVAAVGGIACSMGGLRDASCSAVPGCRLHHSAAQRIVQRVAASGELTPQRRRLRGRVLMRCSHAVLTGQLSAVSELNGSMGMRHCFAYTSCERLISRCQPYFSTQDPHLSVLLTQELLIHLSMRRCCRCCGWRASCRRQTRALADLTAPHWWLCMSTRAPCTPPRCSPASAAGGPVPNL